jgi:hypothetical protein
VKTICRQSFPRLGVVRSTSPHAFAQFIDERDSLTSWII